MLGEFNFTSSKARYFIIHGSELFHILRQQNISLKLFPSVRSYLSKNANPSFSYPIAKKRLAYAGRFLFLFIFGGCNWPRQRVFHADYLPVR